MISSWGYNFIASSQSIWDGFIEFVPLLVGAAVLLIVGCLVAHLVGKAVEQVVGLLKLDRLIEKLSADKYFSRAGIKLNVGGFVGAVVKWFIVVVVLIQSLDILKLTEVTSFLRNVLAYLPSVFVAVIILFAGLFIGEFVDRVVVGASKAAQLGRSRLLGTASRWAIWVFAGLVALYHLGIGAVFSESILNGFVIGIAIAFGLAFGLGGQQHASDLITRIRREASEK